MMHLPRRLARLLHRLNVRGRLREQARTIDLLAQGLRKETAVTHELRCTIGRLAAELQGRPTAVTIEPDGWPVPIDDRVQLGGGYKVVIEFGAKRYTFAATVCVENPAGYSVYDRATCCTGEEHIVITGEERKEPGGA